METIDISAIIIDDDPEAINLLEMFLRQFPNISIVGTSTSAIVGVKIINTQIPDLVFLDIDMPDMTGLEVAQSIRSDNSHSEIVFTTAYQHYAYKALGVEPLDFLTKPFYSEDLLSVIRKYISRTERKRHERKLDKFIQSQSNPPKVKLPTSGGFIILDLNDIVYVKANKIGTQIYVNDGTVETIIRNLKEVIAMLNSSLIVQINRSTCVNLNFMMRLDKKKEICTIRCNNKLYHEFINSRHLANLEKLTIFPVL